MTSAPLTTPTALLGKWQIKPTCEVCEVCITLSSLCLQLMSKKTIPPHRFWLRAHSGSRNNCYWLASTRFRIQSVLKENFHCGERIQTVSDWYAGFTVTCGRKPNPQRKSCGFKNIQIWVDGFWDKTRDKAFRSIQWDRIRYGHNFKIWPFHYFVVPTFFSWGQKP